MTEIFEPIAVIGLAGRLPGAHDANEFWTNLKAGRESVSFPTDEEMYATGVRPDELADPAYVRAVPQVPDVELFDAEFFGMSPREAEICDPQFKLFMEVVHSAIEDAGYSPVSLGRDVGVYGASGPCHYANLHLRNNPKFKSTDMGIVTGNLNDYLATLASYKLDLRGPSMTVLTACSSSLVAVHLACQSLRFGECDVAIAGGSNVEMPYGHGYRWTPGNVRSRDGHCRPFDASATGTVFASGAGAVLLKRLADALADGDHIRAVIRGVAINNDGAEKVSFGAPSVRAQSLAILEAMRMAEFDPADISYVEAHGTGTALGDPIELAALVQAYRNLAGEQPPPCSIPVGSVKANIGHTVPTAGVAGLIKIALALEHEQIPPSANYVTANPNLELDNNPFFITDELRSWPRLAERPRRAGLNSLGIGGTNVHLVVEEGPARLSVPVDGRPRVVVWSGRTTKAADEARERLACYFGEQSEESYGDAVATLQSGRTAHRVRGATVCTSTTEAAQVLGRPGGTPASGDASSPEEVAFLLPGQGAQHSAMAAGLYGEEAVFTEALDECLAGFAAEGLDLRAIWSEGDDDVLRETAHAQPLLFAVEYSLAQMWQAWGIKPTALLGHSVGELVAATLSGVFSLADALRLVVRRGRAMQAMPPGAMLAVQATEESVGALLSDEITVAVVNSPSQIVLGGVPEHIAKVADELALRGVRCRRLRTSHAFHTPLMTRAAEVFAEGFADIRLGPPLIPVYSAATGRLLTDEEATSPDFWAGQLMRPVLFGQSLDALLADGAWTMLETGPGRTLTGVTKAHPAVRGGDSTVLPSLGRGDDQARDDWRSVLETLAKLWVGGHDVDWDAVNQHRPLRRVPVPGYPYQRELFWVDAVSGPAAPRDAVGQLRLAPDEGTAETEESKADPQSAASEPFSMPTWVERARSSASRAPEVRGIALTLLPGDTEHSTPIVIALQQAGYRVVRVRPGERFEVVAEEFRVRPGNADDLAEVLDTLSERAELVVHGLAAQLWPRVDSASAGDQLDRSFLGLLGLVRELGRRSASQPMPRLLVLTTRAVDVSGSEEIDPVKAVLPAQLSTLAMESPGTGCRMIDVAMGTSEDELIAELEAEPEEPVVALRGSRRWIPAEQPYVPVPGDTPPIRRDGVYLVTGGLGALGLAVAKGIARTGRRPRLVLVGRNGLPSEEEQKRRLAQGDEDLRRLLDDLEEIRLLGAEVRVMAADVSDRRQLCRALDIATAHFGPVNGVLHLAGLPGDGMLHFRGREEAEDVLRPKVVGTLVLDEVFAERTPLDFLVLFSSRAALGGMVGSGDYAAANAFLDGYARMRGRGRQRWLSINWPAWSGGGMASGPGHSVAPSADVDAEVKDDLIFETTLSAETCWALDEHRIQGVAVLPGAAHIDLVVRAFREVVGDAGAPLVLEDVVFIRPLVADGAQRTRVCFAPEEGRWKVTVLSRPENGGTEWREHVHGHIGQLQEKPGRVSIEEIRRELPEVEPPSLNGAGRLFALGPRWHNIKHVWAANGTKLADLAITDQFAGDVSEHALHPALLDAGTALARDPVSDGVQLPFMYRRLVLHQDLPNRLLSHIRRSSGAGGMVVADVDLLTPEGSVLASIEGFTMRRAQAEDIVKDGTSASASASASVSPGTRSERGIDPQEGAQLLLTLLASRVCGQVAVRPYVDGRPLRLSRVAPALHVPVIPVPAKTSTEWAAPVKGEEAKAISAAPAVGAPEAADEVMGRLREMWMDALGITEIASTDDFFDIGGDSLSAVELMSQIKDSFGIELSIGVLFDSPTLAQLAGLVRDGKGR